MSSEAIRRRLRGQALPTLDAPAARNTELNQGMPSGPQRMSGQTRQILQAPPSTPVMRVAEINRTGNPISISITNLPIVSSVVIPAPNGRRVFFSVRNSSASGGILLIAFGVTADMANAQYELPAGGIMVLDTFVPQQECYMAGATVPVNIVTTYCDSLQ